MHSRVSCFAESSAGFSQQLYTLTKLGFTGHLFGNPASVNCVLDERQYDLLLIPAPIHLFVDIHASGTCQGLEAFVWMVYRKSLNDSFVKRTFLRNTDLQA